VIKERALMNLVDFKGFMRRREEMSSGKKESLGRDSIRANEIGVARVWYNGSGGKEESP